MSFTSFCAVHKHMATERLNALEAALLRRRVKAEQDAAIARAYAAVQASVK